jgi:hypothetical protein
VFAVVERLIELGPGRGRTRFLTSGDPAALRALVARLLPAPWTREANCDPLGV